MTTTLRRLGISAAVMSYEGWPAQARRALVSRKLAAALERATRDVPFHADRARAAGLAPAAADDLARLPLCTPNELRAVPIDRLLASGTPLRDCRVDRSSASSGTPSAVYLDRRDQAFADAVWIRSYLHLGMRPHFRRVRLRPDDGVASPAPLRRRLPVPTVFEVPSRLAPREQAERIEQLRPQMVSGSPRELLRLARACRDRGRRPRSLRLAVYGGEPMYADGRRLIREALGVEARGVYGATEVGFVAWECGSGQYHVNSDHVFVERLQSASDGEANLAVTTLDRRMMPAIRLVTGDVVGEPAVPCACGSSWPPLGRVRGRESDFLRVGTRGRVVAPERVAAALAPFGGSDLFRLVQARHDELVVHGHPSVLARAATERRIASRLAELLGPEIRIRLTPWEEQPAGSDAKSSLVDSRVPPSSHPPARSEAS